MATRVGNRWGTGGGNRGSANLYKSWQVFFGLLKEPEIELPLDDEDEEGENEEGKPKKKKPKKDSLGAKSKKQDPNAPQVNRSVAGTITVGRPDQPWSPAITLS